MDFCPVHRKTTFMGDIDNIQFQTTDNNNKNRVIQSYNVANRNIAGSNEGALMKHHLLAYDENEKQFLISIDKEERLRGKGFMKRVKRRWDEKYPERTGVSKQNLRDNAIRFRKEREDQMRSKDNIKSDMTLGRDDKDGTELKRKGNKSEWTLEMKINLVKIDRDERKKGRGFMKRMKEAWEERYSNKPMTVQCLRDNATRFKNDKAIMNLLEVREGQNMSEEITGQLTGNELSRMEEQVLPEVAHIEENVFRNEHIYVMENIEGVEGENRLEMNEENNRREHETLREMRKIFMRNVNKIAPTTMEQIEERGDLVKLKEKIKKEELERANKILKLHLEGNNDICKLIDAVYAMVKTIEERMGITGGRKKKRENNKNLKNRRVRKLEAKLKELRQLVARVSNEIYRRTKRRKATKKEKVIFRQLVSKANNSMNCKQQLQQAKEKWLEELRYTKVKMEKMKSRDGKIRDNNLFRDNQSQFYRSIEDKQENQGKVPDIEKFVKFWAGIWEDESVTPYKKWMSTVAEKIRAKIKEVEEIEITEKKLYELLRKRKNWSAPGIDKIPNFWWKKLSGSWKSLVECMIMWIENPEKIPNWMTDGRTVLIPKTEKLDNEQNYRPITCLNTCYKIFTGMVAQYMKDHASRNNIWDESQLGTCSGVLGTVDQLLVDNAIMDEVRNNKRDLAVAFYDYQKAYDMVRHDWMKRVYRWMGIPEKVLMVLEKVMNGWKTRLEVWDKGEIKVSRWINIKKGFLQGDSYSPVGFCLTEVPITMMLEETDGYKMGKAGQRETKRTHSLFIDDLKVYQRNHAKLEIANEIIVKASMDTGACYGVKKCAEVIFKDGKMIKGDGLTVLEEKMKALDPEIKEVYKFLGCEQGDKIDVKRVMERIKKEVRKRTKELVERNLNDKHLMQAINTRVVPVAGYVMNVCRLGKGELDELDKIVKDELRQRNKHGKQASNERLYRDRNEGGRGLKSFKDVYNETKVRVACYLSTSENEWLRVVWANEYDKEQTSLKKEAENILSDCGKDVKFERGYVEIESERVNEWKKIWMVLKKIIKLGAKDNRIKSFNEKKMQSEIPSGYTEEDHGWLKCNTDPRKTAAIFTMQEQMVETRVWKKIRGIGEVESCRLCGEQRETVHHLLSGCKIIAGTEYVRRHDNALKILAVEWGKKEGLISEKVLWYKEKWEKGQVIEKDGKKILWDWEHRMRTNCTARRPDLILEDNEKKEIYIIDMACPGERNIETKRNEKIQKYQQLSFEIRERREHYNVKVIPAVIGCCGGGMKKFKSDIKDLFDEPTTTRICNEMQKTVLWESETILRKILSGLIV